MTDADEPSQTGTPIAGEKWALGDAGQIQEVFRLLAIPPLPGYTPVAITAVGVVVSPAGEVGHYPVYAQVVEAKLSETTEVRAAIANLGRWLLAQRQSGPGGGQPFA